MKLTPRHLHHWLISPSRSRSPLNGIFAGIIPAINRKLAIFMSLIKQSDFEPDTVQLEEWYQTFLELGFPDAQARTEADAVVGEPWVKSYQLPEDCFFCHEKLVIPYVFWMSYADIGLHVDCVPPFTLQLNRDVMEHRHGREQAQGWYTKEKEKVV
jgi:hypothetical protein